MYVIHFRLNAKIMEVKKLLRQKRTTYIISFFLSIKLIFMIQLKYNYSFLHNSKLIDVK